MVYLDSNRKELILVELKRGVLNRSAYEQLCRYMDHVHQSDLLCGYIEQGFTVRGVLAGIKGGEPKVSRSDISLERVDKEQVIKVLGELRKKRWAT